MLHTLVVAGVVALAMLVVPCQLAAQSRWVRLYSDDRMTTDLDTTSVQRSSDAYVVWMQTEYVAARPHPKGSYWSTKTHYILQCRPATRHKLVSAIYYARDGKVVESVHNSPEEAARFAEWRSPIPDTIGEATDTAACRVLAGLGSAGH